MPVDPTLFVGGLRELIKDLDPAADILPEWAYGPPGDEDPAIAVCGFVVREIAGKKHLFVQVDLVPLDELEDDEEEDDDE